MNSRARNVSLALASSLALVAASCSNDSADTALTTVPASVTTAPPTTTPAPPADIVATALTAQVFTTLAGMLLDAGLVETLRSPGPFTVFAPTDEAFSKVPTETLRAVQGDPKLLSTVLTYHVVPGALKLADLQPGKLMTVAGIELEITRNGDQVLVNGYPVTAGDIVASNGIIHVMSDVLVPPT